MFDVAQKSVAAAPNNSETKIIAFKRKNHAGNLTKARLKKPLDLRRSDKVNHDANDFYPKSEYRLICKSRPRQRAR